MFGEFHLPFWPVKTVSGVTFRTGWGSNLSLHLQSYFTFQSSSVGLVRSSRLRSSSLVRTWSRGIRGGLIPNIRLFFRHKAADTKMILVSERYELERNQFPSNGVLTSLPVDVELFYLLLIVAVNKYKEGNRPIDASLDRGPCGLATAF